MRTNWVRTRRRGTLKRAVGTAFTVLMVNPSVSYSGERGDCIVGYQLSFVSESCGDMLTVAWGRSNFYSYSRSGAGRRSGSSSL